MFDPDDAPGYLYDAYGAAFDNGLQSLNLTRIGAGDTRMWQASSRFARSSGYHVEIEADAIEAVMKALGAWTRIGTAPQERTVAKSPVLAMGYGSDKPRQHVLWVTADKDRPKPICDSNGEVVLGQCKICGRGEIELEMEMDGGACPGSANPYAEEMMIELGEAPPEPEGSGLFD